MPCCGTLIVCGKPATNFYTPSVTTIPQRPRIGGRWPDDHHRHISGLAAEDA
jgi:hypothetical protein